MGDTVFGIKIQVSGTETAGESVRKLGADFEESGSRAATSFGKTRAGLESISSQLATLQNYTATFFAGSQFVGFVQGVAHAQIALERFNNIMAIASGNVKAGAVEYARVAQISQKLGLEITSTADAYAKFSAAARGTTMEGEGARQVFESVAGVSAKMGDATAGRGIRNSGVSSVQSKC